MNDNTKRERDLFGPVPSDVTRALAMLWGEMQRLYLYQSRTDRPSGKSIVIDLTARLAETGLIDEPDPGPRTHKRRGERPCQG